MAMKPKVKAVAKKVTDYVLVATASAGLTYYIMSPKLEMPSDYKYEIISERITGLGLTKVQLTKDLAIDNSHYFSRTYNSVNGWQGPGNYEFSSAEYKTPYLEEQQQFKNWSYVLRRETSRELRAIPQYMEDRLNPQQPSAEIKTAVDRITVIETKEKSGERPKAIAEINKKFEKINTKELRGFAEITKKYTVDGIRFRVENMWEIFFAGMATGAIAWAKLRKKGEKKE